MKIVTRRGNVVLLFKIIPGACSHFILLILLMCTLPAGCAAQLGDVAAQGIEIKKDVVATAASSTAEPDIDYNPKIATLLVGTLSQLPGFEPLSITLQITPPKTAFGEAIFQEIRRAGYGLQRVSDDQGRNYVSYARTEIISHVGFIVEYSLSVADVVIFRKFSVNESSITPASALIISGAKPQFIHLYHDLFVPRESDSEFPRNVLFELNNGQQVAYAPDGEIRQRPLTRKHSVASLIEINTAEIIDLNDYASVQELVVEFPTANSNYLGENNKQLIRTIVNKYKALYDVFTLEGCFTDIGRVNRPESPPGQTLLWQKRVTHELMSVGVTQKRIRVSACSGQYTQQELPERTVTINLRRLKTARE